MTCAGPDYTPSDLARKVTRSGDWRDALIDRLSTECDRRLSAQLRLGWQLAAWRGLAIGLIVGSLLAFASLRLGWF